MAKFPSTLGACVDKLYQMRENRLAQQREFDALIKDLCADEAALETHIINKFTKAEIEGCKGEIASVTLSENPLPTVKDWPKVWAFIKKTGAFDLLEKRIAKVAWRTRLGTKDEVPGVEVFVQKSLSLRKRS